MSYWDRPISAIIEYARRTLREVLTVYLVAYFVLSHEFILEKNLLNLFLIAYFFDYAIIWAYVSRDRKEANLDWRVTLSRFLFLSVSSWYYGFWYTVYVAVFTRTMYGCLKKVGFNNVLDAICVTFCSLLFLFLTFACIRSLFL